MAPLMSMRVAHQESHHISPRIYSGKQQAEGLPAQKRSNRGREKGKLCGIAAIARDRRHISHASAFLVCSHATCRPLFSLPSFLSFACLPPWPASGPANSTSTQTHAEWYGRVAVQQCPHRVSTNSPTRQWRISAPDPLSEIQPPTPSATEWCDADLRVVSDIPASSLADQRTASRLEAVRGGGDLCTFGPLWRWLRWLGAAREGPLIAPVGRVWADGRAGDDQTCRAF